MTATTTSTLEDGFGLLDHGGTYRACYQQHVRGQLWSEPVTVEGPFQDRAGDFYVVSTADRDFDITWDGCHWDGGPGIGRLELIPRR